MREADTYFDLKRQLSVAEEDLDNALLRTLGIDPDKPDEWPCADITYDYYDTSFELKNVTAGWQFSAELMPKLGELGFTRCWICYEDGTEQFLHFFANQEKHE